MAKAQVEETKKTNDTGKVMLRRKITAEIIKLADKAVGFEFEGIFVGQSERPWSETNKETGEVIDKPITQFLFERPDKTRFTVFADKGLQNAFSSAGVTPGDKIAVQKLEMIALGGGKRVNSYDIFQISEQ